MAASSLSHDLTRPKRALPIVVLATLLSLLLGAGAWAHWAQIVEASSAMGQVVPSGRVKIVQSVDGGIVRTLSVTEGQRIELGAELATIDSTEAGAQFEENESARAQLAVNAHWLAALLESSTPSFDDGPWSLKQAQRAETEYSATLAAHDAALSVLADNARTRKLELAETQGRIGLAKKARNLAKDRLNMMTELQASGAASRESVMAAQSEALSAETDLTALELAVPRLKAALGEIAAQRREAETQFRATLAARLNETQAKLEQMNEARRGETERVARAVLRAPTSGIVKTVHPAGAGEVVQPAQPVVEILPLDVDLLVRARIDPKDIAFIAPGLNATIRLTAYDYAAFGALDGEVTRIGVDSVEDENGNTYFPVDVTVQESVLPDGRQLPILPGMMAEVHIVTGEKSVLDYLTKPIHRTVTTALRER
ncbi:MAG: HlyD family type I secretion periplasmic adaptor subunit [Pseudomonadota bacterium]